MTIAQAQAARLTERINELQLENDNLDQDCAHAQRMNGILLARLQDVKGQLMVLQGQIAELCTYIDHIVAEP